MSKTLAELIADHKWNIATGLAGGGLGYLAAPSIIEERQPGESEEDYNDRLNSTRMATTAGGAAIGAVVPSLANKVRGVYQKSERDAAARAAREAAMQKANLPEEKNKELAKQLLGTGTASAIVGTGIGSWRTKQQLQAELDALAGAGGKGGLNAGPLPVTPDDAARIMKSNDPVGSPQKTEAIRTAQGVAARTPFGAKNLFGIFNKAPDKQMARYLSRRNLTNAVLPSLGIFGALNAAGPAITTVSEYAKDKLFPQ